MGIFSFLRNDAPFFSLEEQAQLVSAIREQEKNTSGEIRIFAESKNPFVDPLDRAAQIFHKLQMQNTQNRNAVLIYLAVKHKEMAIYGDEGIFLAVEKNYWNNALKEMQAQFAIDNKVNGLEQCIHILGRTLATKFPYDATTDKNELPDEIVFGS